MAPKTPLWRVGWDPQSLGNHPGLKGLLGLEKVERGVKIPGFRGFFGFSG